MAGKLCDVVVLGKLDCGLEIRFPSFSLSCAHYEKVPEVGEKFEWGSGNYKVFIRTMPLVDDWERYNGRPPRVWAEKIKD